MLDADGNVLGMNFNYQEHGIYFSHTYPWGKIKSYEHYHTITIN